MIQKLELKGIRGRKKITTSEQWMNKYLLSNKI